MSSSQYRRTAALEDLQACRNRRHYGPQSPIIISDSDSDDDYSPPSPPIHVTNRLTAHHQHISFSPPRSYSAENSRTPEQDDFELSILNEISGSAGTTRWRIETGGSVTCSVSSGGVDIHTHQSTLRDHFRIHQSMTTSDLTDHINIHMQHVARNIDSSRAHWLPRPEISSNANRPVLQPRNVGRTRNPYQRNLSELGVQLGASSVTRRTRTRGSTRTASFSEGQRMTPTTSQGLLQELRNIVSARDQNPTNRSVLVARLPLVDCTNLGESDRECSICMDEFTVAHPVRLLPCIHKFHHCCIERWVMETTSDPTCPVCRSQITTR